MDGPSSMSWVVPGDASWSGGVQLRRAGMEGGRRWKTGGDGRRAGNGR